MGRVDLLPEPSVLVMIVLGVVLIVLIALWIILPCRDDYWED